MLKSTMRAAAAVSLCLLAVFAAGCDERGDECDEAGCGADAFVSECERDPGSCEPDPCQDDPSSCEEDPGPPEFVYVIIDDLSAVVAANGTPGVDICGVKANCEGSDVFPAGAELGVGEEYICGEEPPPAGIECSADRNDPQVALTYGSCDAESNPSDYVSLGGGGRLTVTFGRDLQGCTLSILEASGSTSRDETAEVSVCADAVASECLTVQGDVVLGTVDEGANPATVVVPVIE